MNFSKVTNCLGAVVFSLCLLIGLTMTSSQSTKAESVLGSAEDKGIKFTVHNYEIQNYGQEMMVYYTIQSASGAQMSEDEMGLIKNLDFSIGSRMVQGNDAWHKKVSNQEYQGAIKVDLPKYGPATSNVSLNTDSILNQKGQWTINFQIQK